MFSRMRTGVGRLFDKPLDLKELAAAVDELLARADGCAQAAVTTSSRDRAA